MYLLQRERGREHTWVVRRGRGRWGSRLPAEPGPEDVDPEIGS